MRRLAAMFIFAIGAFGLVGGLTACATTYPGEPASAHDQEREDQDLFELGIEAGRIGVFTSRIAQAGELIEAPATGGDDAIHVSRRLREATFEFFTIKERMCDEVKLVETSCAQIRPPAWLAEEPSQKITSKELRRRVEEVQALMTPLVDAACVAGKAKSGDEMFCSVE
jgi:hypothetical protein